MSFLDAFVGKAVDDPGGRLTTTCLATAPAGASSREGAPCLLQAGLTPLDSRSSGPSDPRDVGGRARVAGHRGAALEEFAVGTESAAASEVRPGSLTAQRRSSGGDRVGLEQVVGEHTAR